MLLFCFDFFDFVKTIILILFMNLFDKLALAASFDLIRVLLLDPLSLIIFIPLEKRILFPFLSSLKVSFFGNSPDIIEFFSERGEGILGRHEGSGVYIIRHLLIPDLPGILLPKGDPRRLTPNLPLILSPGILLRQVNALAVSRPEFLSQQVDVFCLEKTSRLVYFAYDRLYHVFFCLRVQALCHRWH